MKVLAIIALLLLLPPTAGFSAGVQLWLSGVDEEQSAAIEELWPEAELLSPELRWDAPYPDLLPHLNESATLLLINVAAGSAGLAVSGRVIGAGGYDVDLGTVHTADQSASLLEAVRGFFDRLEGLIESTAGSSPDVTLSLGAGEIAEMLADLYGWGVAPTDDPTRREEHRSERRAYDAAEADFLERLEGTLYPKALLDAVSYTKVIALVRGYLFVAKGEFRPADAAYGVEVRLTPEGIRLLTWLLLESLS